MLKVLYIYKSTEPIDAVNILPSNPRPRQHPLALHQTPTLPTAPLRHPKKGCSGSTDIDDDLCTTRRILVLFQWMASISFASESLMDPRISLEITEWKQD